MNRTRLALLAAAAFLLLAGWMTWTMLEGRRWRVEVCMEYRGRSACRTAAGATREEALRTAVDNACALLASGMTESIQCGRSEPRSVRVLAGE